jgi:hypothetical protein
VVELGIRRRLDMGELTRRTALVAGSVSAVTLLGAQAVAQQREGGAEREVSTDLGEKQRLRTASPTRRWYALNFPTLQAAVNYVNAPPAQGPGEFIISDRPTGSGYDAAVYL